MNEQMNVHDFLRLIQTNGLLDSLVDVIETEDNVFEELDSLGYDDSFDCDSYDSWVELFQKYFKGLEMTISRSAVLNLVSIKSLLNRMDSMFLEMQNFGLGDDGLILYLESFDIEINRRLKECLVRV